MKNLFSFTAASVAICFLAPVPTTAQEKSVKPGINKPFENPDLKDFLKKFEGESREIAAQAKEIVAACKLKPGMAVADVGAGTGLFTRKFAVEVGDKGKVFAVDIAPTFLRYIEKTCEDAKIKNVETIQCDQFSTKLPKNSVDVVFICDTYHHFEFPTRTLQSVHDALRPGGRVILIDFHRIEGKSSAFVMGHVRAGQEIFVREITSAGFKVVGEEKFLKENYFVQFEKVDGVEEGYTSLFNGKDLTGWEYGPVPVSKKPIIEKLEGKTVTKDGVFEVKDGHIVATGKRIMALYTTREYNKDFIFKLEFRNSADKPKDNSGIYIRGPQLQLDAVTEGGLTGVFRKLTKFKVGDWNEIEISVKGTEAVCKCNGEMIGKKAMNIPATGTIGLQSEYGRFEFRRIRIKELP